MSTIRLEPVPLTVAAFKPFGDVVEDSGDAELINQGTSQKFADLAAIEVDTEDGRTGVSIYDTAPASFPLTIRALERHPLSSQLFMPLSVSPFLIVVAEPGDAVDPGSVRSFISNGRQGVNYRPGTWHHPLIALNNPTRFLVVDREGPGDNCDLFQFAAGDEVIVEVAPTSD